MKKNIIFIIIAMIVIACEKNNESELLDPVETRADVILETLSYNDILSFQQMQFSMYYYGNGSAPSIDIIDSRVNVLTAEMISYELATDCNNNENEFLSFGSALTPGWYYLSFDFHDRYGEGYSLPITDCYDNEIIYIDQGTNLCYAY